MFHGSPGADDSISRPEGEVVKVLVQGVSGGHLARVWRLVDQHGVHGADLGTSEGLIIVLQAKQKKNKFNFTFLNEINFCIITAIEKSLAGNLQ